MLRVRVFTIEDAYGLKLENIGQADKTFENKDHAKMISAILLVAFLTDNWLDMT